MHKVRWTASLSNGETVYEEKGNFITQEKELSPWQRLLLRVAETGTHITSLSLYTDDGRRWNLPSAGNNPKFHAFAIATKPAGYRFFRKFGTDGIGGTPGVEDRFSCIEAHYEHGQKLQVWVDEATGNAWSVAL